MLRYPLNLLFLLLFIPAGLAADAGGDELIWGATSVRLKPVLAVTPEPGVSLANNANAVSLGQFYLVGGEDRPATPTECWVAYSEEALLVEFRCHEKDMTFPARSQSADWYGLLSSPSEQDSGFPDKVDLCVQPDMKSHSYYQFAATLDGRKFGWWHGGRTNASETAQTDENGATASAHGGKTEAFSANVTKQTNEWIVSFSIPWQTLGGKPTNCFGLLPTRTRWRASEVSSPVAMDFNERPPTDLFVEADFCGDDVGTPQTSLVQLPSSTLRWQRPAMLSYPDADTVRKIWRMEESLGTPTGTNDLAECLYLTQRWEDLLTLEGFNFLVGRGGIVEQSITPATFRHQINGVLRTNDVVQACSLLDGYLGKLDKVSRQWFADGSPGDILKEEWKPVAQVTGMNVESNVLVMRCVAGGRAVDLHLSLPELGGVRIYGEAEGYFKPSGLRPVNVQRAAGVNTIQTGEGKVTIRETPLEISFYDAAGKQVLNLGPDDIAFRFDGAGKVMAVDVKSHLDTGESIWGFGERYNRFDEHGNVLTLWGMDDWTGNTIGLLSQTYKPIPVFHSSRGFMVFDNSSYRLRADIGKTRADQWRLTQQGPILDFYFWAETPERALQSYTELTGKPILPPRWAFESWMGRTGRGWNKPSGNQVATEEDVVKRFAKLDIPHSAIYAEGNGADSPELNAFMAARGIKVLSWFYPIIPRATQAKLMPEVKPADLPVVHMSDPWQHVDFSNPNALELFRRWWKHRLDVGVAGSMVDFGDRVTEDAKFWNGKRGDEMHNFYSYDYHRTCSEVFREKRGDDFILFGRAAAPGTQKWVAQFAGDHASNFQALRGVMTGALNLCACGFSTWGSDLGGFLGWPEPAVYMRWTQFGCFSPLMRCHGRTPREPWNYGDAAVANYKYYAWVRENLLDYIYNSAVAAHETGVPLMRSLAVAFPDEAALATNGDEYMFGRDLLVAPVVDERDSRTICFPAGTWTSLWDGKSVAGPAEAAVDVPLNTIPVYLKAGAVVPVQLSPALEFGESMSQGRVGALVVTVPKEKESMSFVNGQGGEADVISTPVAGGFDVMLRSSPDTGYVLIYGTGASEVKMDGKELAKVQSGEFASMSAGWCVDARMNRVVVRLPAGTDRGIEVRF